jgi:SAM-dependent methyltransferase
VLRRALAGGQDPYAWTAAALGSTPNWVLDIGAGSGPMARYVDLWVGIDRSLQELALARSAGTPAVVCAAGSALPVRDSSAAAAVLVMSLQVLEPVGGIMAELARVVRPGGRVVLLLPARSPLSWRDKLFFLLLQLRLRQRITYPNDAALATGRLRRLAAATGFAVTDDVRRAFVLPLSNRADADELVRSLYLPGVDERRISRAVEQMATRVGKSVSIPLRRVVVRRSVGNG